MKPRAVIVGAGLAGSILASGLREHYAVTVVELGKRPEPLPTPIVEKGTPLRLDIHAGAGPGGSTSFWHNGLIELEEEDYLDWPVAKNELAPHVAQSLKLLGGVEQDVIAREDAAMRRRFAERGVAPGLLGKSIFYPRRRINVWKHLGLPGHDIACVAGFAHRFEMAPDGKVQAVIVETATDTRRLEGDIFIASAGGLASPILVAETARESGLHLPAVGRHYHDHPMGWVGQMQLDLKLYDIWNHSAPALAGALRLPFVIRGSRGKFAFYVRTQAQGRHLSARSALTDLRNNPGNLRNYWKVMGNSGDVLEVLAFQFGINIPASVFSILMVAEQPPDDSLSIHASGDGGIVRNWTLPPQFEADANAALLELKAAFGNHVVDFAIQPDWPLRLQTAAHHSGGCRMAIDSGAGVCDSDLRIFHTRNLYVCDGSVLPSSGYSNTGLMIGALALRLAQTLRSAA